MPFITEEIYQTYFAKNEGDSSIHISSWPESKKESQPSARFTAFCSLLSSVRQAKTTAQKAMNSEIILTLDKKYIEMLGSMTEDFKSVTNAKEIKQGKFKVEFI
jgi:valyl-tRNA synthetase